MSRLRKPTRLKVIDGTYNVTHDGKSRKDEPNVHPPRIPDPPAHLSRDEVAAWNFFANVLDANKVVTDEDAAAFEQLAVTWAQWLHITQTLREMKGEYTYESVSKHGTMQRAVPEMAVLDTVDRRLSTLLAKFGLTPSDRSRVKMMKGGSGGKDPESEFGRP